MVGHLHPNVVSPQPAITVLPPITWPRPVLNCHYVNALAAFAVFALALLDPSTQGEAQPSAATPFAQACRDRLPNIQPDRRVCLVGIVRGDREVDVLASSTEDLIGQRVAVYSSSVVQRGLTPLAELSALTERIVVVGGFVDGHAIYSAKLLSGVP
jgi:hypothetical protein